MKGEKRTIDTSWLEQQVSIYTIDECPRYQLFSEMLEELLHQVCKANNILGIVMARAKSIPSFTEKVIRKSHKYHNPVHQLTDLCGVRVITVTQEEVETICRFIEDTFKIDEENSLDVKTLLRVEEFGYRSVHYVVQLDPENPFIADVLHEVAKRKGIENLAQEIGDRKGEIQVRTLLQHAWAMISHDRFYKSNIQVPERFRRELARVAALLEGADEEFGMALRGIEQYQRNYLSYMTRNQIRQEILKWELVLKYDEGNTQLAHKIAQFAIALEDWFKAIHVLEPYADSGKSFILRDLGKAKSHAKEGGRNELNRAVELDPNDADAWCALADTWVGENDRKALDYYERAFQVAPSDPHILAKYLECKLKFSENIDFIPLMYPNLEAAIDTCNKLADVRVYLPWAFYDIGKFALLMNKPYESLSAFAKAITLSNSTFPIEEAMKSIEIFQRPILRSLPSMPELHDLEWALEAVHRFLIIAKVAKLIQLRDDAKRRLEINERELHESMELLKSTESESEPAPDQIAKVKANAEASVEKRKQAWNLSMTEVQVLDEKVSKARTYDLKDLVVTEITSVREPIFIFSGGCSSDVQSEMEEYTAYLETAIECFTGTMIGGGTTSGISGIIGNIAPCSGNDIRKVGYLPYYLPHTAEIHKGYETYIAKDVCRGCAETIRTTDFTPLEPIQAWIDILHAGVNPSQVRLLGINGGNISGFEYRMALAFGANVGIVQSSGRSASELRSDSEWWGPPNLIWLPKDKMALRAFVNPGRSRLDPAQIQRVGKVIHEKFLEENRYKNIDPAMMPWDLLREDLRQSNIGQADYAEKVLDLVGYGVREAKGSITIPEFSNDEIEIMAELEHGRWIVERLSAGWQYGPERAPQNKISPYLVAWDQLPEDIKEYDRIAVKEIPLCLKEAGLEVYRIE